MAEPHATLDTALPVKTSSMAAEVRHGLLGRRPSLPSKYFYDDRGSALFERITQLPEYYQTRTEEALLERIADDVVARTRPSELVELGSGAGRKIALLLEAMARAGQPGWLTLFDINASFVDASARRLARQFPDVHVRGVTGDFTEHLAGLGPGGARLAVFFAGTIGNLHPAEVPLFLARVARQLEPGDGFLVGVDLVKDVARLEAAYNDAEGVTAEFNRNVLRHCNEALGANFALDMWEHVAFYNAESQWIEMRLRARRDVRVRVPGAAVDRVFRAGEEIRTELSCKYTRDSFARRLPGTGLALQEWYTDPDELFALVLLRRIPAALRPA